MQTHSKYQYQPFEHSGKEVRFHWDVQSYEVQDDTDLIVAKDNDLHYSAQEALCLDSDSPEIMLEKILAEGCDLVKAQELVNLWVNR